jgi:hypothetical protein
MPHYSPFRALKSPAPISRNHFLSLATSFSSSSARPRLFFFSQDAFDGVFLFDEMSAEDAIISELVSVAPPPATMDMGMEGMMTMMNSSPTAADPAPSAYNMQPQAAIAIDAAQQQQQQQQQGFFCEAVVPVSARAANPTPRRAPSRSTANKSIKCSDDNNKSCKWKRRNVEKHLAGERSRRAKRMDRVNTLRAMLTGLPTEKPTVNQILSAAIDQVKQVKIESLEPTARAALLLLHTFFPL